MLKANVLFLDPKSIFTGGDKWEKYLYDQIECTRKISFSYISYRELRLMNKYLRPFYLLRQLNAIADCDIVFLSSSVAPIFFATQFLLYKLYPSIKIYVVHHHFAADSLSGIKKYIYNFTQKISLKYCKAVITPNIYVKDQILKLLPLKKIVFLEMSFDKHPILLSSYNKYQLLYVGTVYPRKGLEYLINSLSLLTIEERQDIHLNIVGNISSYDYYDFLRTLIVQKGLSECISFRGKVSKEDLEKYYSSSYCFVFPSLLEGYGMVLIEAMSYGLPVIAFNNSAIPYTVKNYINGILVPNKDVRAFSDSLKQIMFDSNLHHKLSEGSIKTYLSTRSLDDFNKDVNLFVKNLLSAFGFN